MLLKDIHEYSGIYLAIGATDLRRAVYGLSHMVKQDFNMDQFGNYRLLFFNKSRTRFKAGLGHILSASIHRATLPGRAIISLCISHLAEILKLILLAELLPV